MPVTLVAEVVYRFNPSAGPPHYTTTPSFQITPGSAGTGKYCLVFLSTPHLGLWEMRDVSDPNGNVWTQLIRHQHPGIYPQDAGVSLMVYGAKITSPLGAGNLTFVARHPAAVQAHHSFFTEAVAFTFAGMETCPENPFSMVSLSPDTTSGVSGGNFTFGTPICDEVSQLVVAACAFLPRTTGISGSISSEQGSITHEHFSPYDQGYRSLSIGWKEDVAASGGYENWVRSYQITGTILPTSSMLRAGILVLNVDNVRDVHSLVTASGSLTATLRRAFDLPGAQLHENIRTFQGRLLGGKIEPAAALSGDSFILTARLGFSIPVEASISGNGSLASALGYVLNLAAALSGNGTMTSSLAWAFSTTQSGNGNLTAAMVGGRIDAATSISGNGSLAGALRGGRIRCAASISGTGNLVLGDPDVSFQAKALLCGHGDIGHTKPPAFIYELGRYTGRPSSPGFEGSVEAEITIGAGKSAEVGETVVVWFSQNIAEDPSGHWDSSGPVFRFRLSMALSSGGTLSSSLSGGTVVNQQLSAALYGNSNLEQTPSGYEDGYWTYYDGWQDWEAVDGKGNVYETEFYRETDGSYSDLNVSARHVSLIIRGNVTSRLIPGDVIKVRQIPRPIGHFPSGMPTGAAAAVFQGVRKRKESEGHYWKSGDWDPIKNTRQCAVTVGPTDLSPPGAAMLLGIVSSMNQCDGDPGSEDDSVCTFDPDDRFDPDDDQWSKLDRAKTSSTVIPYSLGDSQITVFPMYLIPGYKWQGHSSLRGEGALTASLTGGTVGVHQLSAGLSAAGSLSDVRERVYYSGKVRPDAVKNLRLETYEAREDNEILRSLPGSRLRNPFNSDLQRLCAGDTGGINGLLNEISPYYDSWAGGVVVMQGLSSITPKIYFAGFAALAGNGNLAALLAGGRIDMERTDISGTGTLTGRLAQAWSVAASLNGNGTFFQGWYVYSGSGNLTAALKQNHNEAPPRLSGEGELYAYLGKAIKLGAGKMFAAGILKSPTMPAPYLKIVPDPADNPGAGFEPENYQSDPW